MAPHGSHAECSAHPLRLIFVDLIILEVVFLKVFEVLIVILIPEDVLEVFVVLFTRGFPSAFPGLGAALFVGFFTGSVLAFERFLAGTLTLRRSIPLPASARFLTAARRAPIFSSRRAEGRTSSPYKIRLT